MKYMNTKSSKNASKSRMQIKLPRFNWHGLKMNCCCVCTEDTKILPLRCKCLNITDYKRLKYIFT